MYYICINYVCNVFTDKTYAEHRIQSLIFKGYDPSVKPAMSGETTQIGYYSNYTLYLYIYTIVYTFVYTTIVYNTLA